MKKFGPDMIYLIPSAVIGAVILLLTVAFFFKGKAWGLIFLFFFALPVVFILTFINFRFLHIHEDKLCVVSIFGKRCFPWDAITQVKTARLGMRNVLWIEAGDSAQIVPLIFSHLQLIKRLMAEKLGDRCESEGWERSHIDLILLYMTAGFLAFIVISKIAF